MTQNNISLLYSAAEIGNRIKNLAEEIALDTKPQQDNLMVIALLKGSFIFTADLVRALHNESCHPQIDFMTLSSYGKEKTSSGNVTINSDLSEDIKGKDIILVDDILESGRTLNYAKTLLEERGAASISICVLLDKPSNRSENININPDYTGFIIENHFVVGYGLDHANYHRELPYIGVLGDKE